LVRADVVHIGACALFWRAHIDGFNAEEFADAAGGIVYIPHPDGLGWAHLNAGGLQPLINPVGTEIAFGRRVRVVVDINRVVGTGLHAHFAPDAVFVVEVDNSIFTDEQGSGGTSFHAGRVGAVITPHNAHFPGCRGVFTLVDVLHPSAELPDGHIMFSFTRHRACMASDTCALIYCKAVAQGVTSF